MWLFNLRYFLLGNLKWITIAAMSLFIWFQSHRLDNCRERHDEYQQQFENIASYTDELAKTIKFQEQKAKDIIDEKNQLVKQVSEAQKKLNAMKKSLDQSLVRLSARQTGSTCEENMEWLVKITKELQW